MEAPSWSASDLPPAPARAGAWAAEGLPIEQPARTKAQRPEVVPRAPSRNGFDPSKDRRVG